MPNLRYIFVHSLDMDAWDYLPGIVSSHFDGRNKLLGFAASEDRFSEERDEDPSVPFVLELCNQTGPLPMMYLPAFVTEDEVRSDLRVIETCTWLTHLSIGFGFADNNSTEERGRDIPLVRLIREALAPLVQLEALHIPMLSFPGYGDDVLADIALALAHDCQALTFIRLQGKSWRVRRRGKVSREAADVKLLESSEDGIDMPGFFQGPRSLVDWIS